MLIRNFLFHRVSREKDQLWPPMDPALFESVIAHLKKHYLVVKLEELLESPASYQQSGKKLATVVFDDGFRDNIEFAAPILRNYDCPASFYVVTGCISKGIPTWTYLLDYYFQRTSKLSLKLPGELPGFKKEIFFKDSGERFQLGKRLKPVLKKMKNRKRVAYFRAVQESFSDLTVPEDKMMNWEEVASLSSQGFEIGSHSATHALLASVEDDEELSLELTESAKTIKEKVGYFPKTISYPVGSFDNRVMEQARAAGYRYGLAVEQRFYNTATDDIMAIPRVELYNESFFKTRLRISGLVSTIKGGLWAKTTKGY